MFQEGIFQTPRLREFAQNSLVLTELDKLGSAIRKQEGKDFDFRPMLCEAARSIIGMQESFDIALPTKA